MDKKALKETALGGLINNPVFVLVLGICPTIGTSTTLVSAFSMGCAVTFVLICSNIFISLLRKLIPDQVRLPAYIIIIATFVTVVQLFMDKFVPDLYDSMKGFIGLIVVNCIIFARAEAFAGKNENGVLASFIDGLSMGGGFLLAICLLGGMRQILTDVLNMAIFATPAGGFIALALLLALFNAIFYYAKRFCAKRKSKMLLTNASGEAE